MAASGHRSHSHSVLLPYQLPSSSMTFTSPTSASTRSKTLSCVGRNQPCRYRGSLGRPLGQPIPLSRSRSSSILTRFFFFLLSSSSSRSRFFFGSIIFSVGGGPGGIGGSTFSGGGGPGGGCGIEAGDPGGFLFVGEVGADISSCSFGNSFLRSLRWREAAAQCNRFVGVLTRRLVSESLPKPTMLCVEVLGTTFSR